MRAKEIVVKKLSRAALFSKWNTRAKYCKKFLDNKRNRNSIQDEKDLRYINFILSTLSIEEMLIWVQEKTLLSIFLRVQERANIKKRTHYTRREHTDYEMPFLRGEI